MVVKSVLKRIIVTVVTVGLVIGGVASIPSAAVFAEGEGKDETVTITFQSDDGYLGKADPDETTRVETIKKGEKISSELYIWFLNCFYEGYRGERWAIDYWVDQNNNEYQSGYGPRGEDLGLKEINESLVLKPHWVEMVNIKYDYNGGYTEYKTLGGDSTVKYYDLDSWQIKGEKYKFFMPFMHLIYGTKESSYDYPVRDGYEFEGFSLDGTGELISASDKDATIIPSTDLKYVAVWKKKEDSSSSNDTTSTATTTPTTTTTTPATPTETKKYSNEWVDGKWYNADGTQTYKGTLTWKNDSTGWWVEDTDGWYPQSSWQKIDGKWYYFTDSGYMDYSEYRDGCWLGSDGAWVEEYYGGHWCSNSTGWWYEDSSGWYPQSQYVWIDGTEYWFGADGYWK